MAETNQQPASDESLTLALRFVISECTRGLTSSSLIMRLASALVLALLAAFYGDKAASQILPADTAQLVPVMALTAIITWMLTRIASNPRLIPTQRSATAADKPPVKVTIRAKVLGIARPGDTLFVEPLHKEFQLDSSNEIVVRDVDLAVLTEKQLVIKLLTKRPRDIIRTQLHDQPHLYIHYNERRR